jgi:hypothetical protein
MPKKKKKSVRKAKKKPARLKKRAPARKPSRKKAPAVNESNTVSVAQVQLFADDDFPPDIGGEQ